MVPWAPHGVRDDQPVGKRPAIVRAARSDREEFIAAACEQNGFLAHVSADHAAVGEIIERDALREVRTRRLRWLAHGRLLTERKPRAGPSYQSPSGKNPGGDNPFSPGVSKRERRAGERLESPIMFADGAASKSQTEGANRSLFAEICLAHLSVGPDLLGRTRYDGST